MSLHVCMHCRTRFAPAALCPHCGYDSFLYDWEEDDMPKATVEGGGSDHALGAPEDAVAAPAEPKQAPRPRPQKTAQKAAEDDK